MRNYLAVAAIFCLTLLFTGCTKSTEVITDPEVPEIPDPELLITAIQFKSLTGQTFAFEKVTVKIGKDTIIVSLPYNADLERLVSTINHNGISISPEPSTITDYHEPVSFTIRAESGKSREYVVVVSAVYPSAMLYFGGSDNMLHAWNAADGAPVWTYAGTQSFAYSTPAVSKGILYAGGIDGYLYAFDAMKGTVLFKTFLSGTGIESPPCINRNTVYVGTNDDFLNALDATTGEIRWQYPTWGNVSTRPVIYQDRVIFGSSDGFLYALDTATGSLQWKFATMAMINGSHPYLDNDVVYVGSRDGFLYAVNVSDGSLKWKTDFGGISLEDCGPVKAGNNILIAGWYNTWDSSQAGALYAVDAGTGLLQWTALPNTGFSSDIALDGNNVFVNGDDLKIHALSIADGHEIWSHQVFGNGGSPIAANGVVYAGSGGERLFYAFDSKMGKIRWQRRVENSIMIGKALFIDKNGAPSAP
ncbi:outer membrane protein assembly factor BamB family protein [Flavihumibacter petaseus]|uniref:Pyrrolo-quinoline quinone repeat domain-containing protein n=1 Tax=Flavihumibacter petaseus NBRC 106054 TaxID=1220578 RepID=A0A0E9N0M0_9BACT|nr:PQQ-binding-like beta-propeller repeat protein [Flavihumibacter petaseus]GAO43374.1 hypothetical protein FPE01S_02_04790 [Flavihumibacter petaseus NBRC 106054]